MTFYSHQRSSYSDVKRHIDITERRNETTLYYDTNTIFTIISYYVLKGEKRKSIEFINKLIKEYSLINNPLIIDDLKIEKIRIYLSKNKFVDANYVLQSIQNTQRVEFINEQIKLGILNNYPANEITSLCKKCIDLKQNSQELGLNLTYFLSINKKVDQAQDCIDWVYSINKNIRGYDYQLSRIALAYEKSLYDEVFKLCAKLLQQNKDDIITNLYYAKSAQLLLKDNVLKHVIRNIQRIFPDCQYLLNKIFS